MTKSQKWPTTSLLHPFLRNPLLIALRTIKSNLYISTEQVLTLIVSQITRPFLLIWFIWREWWPSLQEADLDTDGWGKSLARQQLKPKVILLRIQRMSSHLIQVKCKIWFTNLWKKLWMKGSNRGKKRKVYLSRKPQHLSLTNKPWGLIRYLMWGCSLKTSNLMQSHRDLSVSKSTIKAISIFSIMTLRYHNMTSTWISQFWKTKN